jgi:hypothetical protein
MVKNKLKERVRYQFSADFLHIFKTPKRFGAHLSLIPEERLAKTSRKAFAASP